MSPQYMLYLRTKYFLCVGQYETALAVAQTALAFSAQKRGIMFTDIVSAGSFGRLPAIFLGVAMTRQNAFCSRLCGLLYPTALLRPSRSRYPISAA